MENLVLECAAVAASVAIAITARYVRLWTGVQIEEKHQRALHEALTSGAVAAYTDGPKEAANIIIDRAIEHARLSVPDAIAALRPETTVLRRIAQRKADEVRPFEVIEGLLEKVDD